MSQRYRQRYAEDGDVFDPLVWVRNLAELADEFNSAIDRDNLPEQAVTEEKLEEHACTEMYSDPHQYAIDPDFVSIPGDRSWLAEDASGVVLGRVELDLKYDAIATVEWSGGYVWNLGGAPYTPNCVRFRITVDGTAVCTTGWLSLSRDMEGTYLVGSLPVSAGHRVFQAELMTAFINIHDAWCSAEAAADDPLSVQGRELVVEVTKR